MGVQGVRSGRLIRAQISPDLGISQGECSSVLIEYKKMTEKEA